jgi:hypothetical protein
MERLTSISNPNQKIQARQSHRSSRLISKNAAFFGISSLVLVGLSLDWQLVVATGAAIAAMSNVYSSQSWNWRKNGVRLKQFLQGSNGKLAIAVTIGSSTMLLFYTILAIWNSQGDHWLGFGESLQFLAILAVLGLLLKQVFQTDSNQSQKRLNRLVLDLASENDLQRLIAVRQLGQSIKQIHLPLDQEQAIAEYCEVLLRSETFMPVREAAFELLESLQQVESPKIMPNQN